MTLNVQFRYNINGSVKYVRRYRSKYSHYGTAIGRINSTSAIVVGALYPENNKDAVFLDCPKSDWNFHLCLSFFPYFYFI